MKAERTTGTVLIVDDDENIRKILAYWVAGAGHSVKAAADADAALGVLDSEAIDVAICDIRMPGHDGVWLLDKIRDHHPDVAVVVATGLMEMDPGVTLRPGVVGYLVKPFSRTEVTNMVLQGLVERRRLKSTAQGDRLLPDSALDDIVLSVG